MPDVLLLLFLFFVQKAIIIGTCFLFNEKIKSHGLQYLDYGCKVSNKIELYI